MVGIIAVCTRTPEESWLSELVLSALPLGGCHLLVVKEPIDEEGLENPNEHVAISCLVDEVSDERVALKGRRLDGLVGRRNVCNDVADHVHQKRLRLGPNLNACRVQQPLRVHEEDGLRNLGKHKLEAPLHVDRHQRSYEKLVLAPHFFEKLAKRRSNLLDERLQHWLLR